MQQANRDLEKKISSLELLKKESSDKVNNLQERNDELCTELAAMDKMYQNLGKEKQKNDHEIDGQMLSLQNEVDEQKQRIVDLQSNLHNLKKVCS